MILSAEPTVARHLPFTSYHSAQAVLGVAIGESPIDGGQEGCWPILFPSINFSRDLSIFEASMDTADQTLFAKSRSTILHSGEKREKECVCITVKKFCSPTLLACSSFFHRLDTFPGSSDSPICELLIVAKL